MSQSRTLALFCLGLLFLGAGCRSGGAALNLSSYKDPYFPESLRIELNECVYRIDPAGDTHILGRASRAPDALGGGSVQQILHIHLFWRPRPGKTFDNPTTVDATVRYVVTTEEGTRTYDGTGFVYVSEARFGDRLNVNIENVRLKPVAARGAAPDVIGDARLTGKLRAKRDSAAVIDGVREATLVAGVGD